MMQVCDMYLGSTSPAPLLVNHPSAAVSPLSPLQHTLSPCFSTEVMLVEEPAAWSSWWRWQHVCVSKRNKDQEDFTIVNSDTESAGWSRLKYLFNRLPSNVLQMFLFPQLTLWLFIQHHLGSNTVWFLTNHWLHIYFTAPQSKLRWCRR